MTAVVLCPLSTALSYSAFTVFVMIKLGKRADRWAYTLWPIATVTWQLLGAALYTRPSPSVAMFFCRLGYTGIVFLPFTMLHFCAAFLESKSLKRLLPVNYMIATFFGISVWVDHIFLNGYYEMWWGDCPRASWLHPFFLLAVGVQLTIFMQQLSLKLRDKTLSFTRREQIRLIRLALIWYSFGAVDFLVNYGINYFPLGFVFCIISLGYVTYAMVRHQLLDIRVIIRRTMVYSVASTILTSMYVGILLITMRLLQPWLGAHSYISISIACGITALCHPLIRRIQRPIDRILGRNRLDHGMELMKFSTQLGQDQSLERARTLLSQIIEEAFRPTGYVIYRKSDKGYDIFLRQGLPMAPEHLEPENHWTAMFESHRTAEAYSDMGLTTERLRADDVPVYAATPLISQKNLQGFMLLGEKQSEEAYSEQDLILLKILANQAAIVLERPRLIKEVGSGFAHEIKTPLANIAMPAELSFLELQDMLEKGDKNPSELLPVVMKRLQFIVEQALFASDRVDAMQQLSEASSPKRRHISLQMLVQRVTEELAPMAQKANVALESDIESGLFVLGHERQLEILISNLMRNGIEAINHTQTGIVRVRARLTREGTLIDVEDSGPGIPQHQQQNVFEPHFSTKNGSTRGMGLYLTKQVVQAHHGTLVYDREDGLTVMRVTLPSGLIALTAPAVNS